MAQSRSFPHRLAVWVSCWLGLAACDTGAVGVESCRSIEYARCSAAAHCPGTFGLKSVDSCKRFYRDHCLHGLALASDPGPSKVNPCVAAIEKLGGCASRQEDLPASECTEPSSETVCELLASPENIPECSFLGSPSDAGTTTGGVAGTGGAANTGGADESGGAPSTGGANATGGAPSSGGVTSTGGTEDATGGSVSML